MTCPWLHWTTDNLSGMHMVSISTPVCVNFELRPGAGDIHICFTAGWVSHLAPAIYMFLVNFDALAQASKSKGGCVVRACVCVSYNFSWRGDITKLTLWHGYQSLVDGFFWNIKYDTWYGVSIANNHRLYCRWLLCILGVTYNPGGTSVQIAL